MDAGDLPRRHGMAGGLAWLAAGAVGGTKSLAGRAGVCAIADPVSRPDQGRLSQHDLGGFDADAVFHHRCDGVVG